MREVGLCGGSSDEPFTPLSHITLGAKRLRAKRKLTILAEPSFGAGFQSEQEENHEKPPTGFSPFGDTRNQGDNRHQFDCEGIRFLSQGHLPGLCFWEQSMAVNELEPKLKWNPRAFNQIDPKYRHLESP